MKTVLLALLVSVLVSTSTVAQDPPLPIGLGEDEPVVVEEGEINPKDSPNDLHGFWKSQLGSRLSRDSAQPRDLTIAESRLQLRWDKSWNGVFKRFNFTGDLVVDEVSKSVELDLLDFNFTLTPSPSLDLTIGRQVATWGTGDMLFINDLFPKDFPSLLVGRGDEYLKAPTNAIRLGWYNDIVNVDLVYTPRFVPDTIVTGERLSFWNPVASNFAGSDNQLKLDVPKGDATSLRLYRNFGSWEVALYGHWGYWPSLGGQKPFPLTMTFPRLNVYGASLRGPVGAGITTFELGYYDSVEDQDGTNPFVRNSELRLLLGYEQEVAKDLTIGVQYYLEHMLNHDNYRQTNLLGEAQDENRHVFTGRITKFWKHKDLMLSVFGYYSPSDQDGYIRPSVSYKFNDSWETEVGANWFWGDHNHTAFGQLEGNSNIYASIKLSF